MENKTNLKLENKMNLKLNYKNVSAFTSRYAIFIILFFIFLIIEIWSLIQGTNIITLESLNNILMQSAVRIIIALGAGFILITAGVDLSAGRMVGFAAVISSSMLQTQDYLRRFYPNLPDLPLWLPILLAIAAGLLFGIINGFAVSKLHVPPFIATLGSMLIIYGINSIYFSMEPNNSQPIGGLRKDFTTLGSGDFFGFPYIVMIAVVIAVIVWVIFNKTNLGKNMYAIGGNINAAKVSGINITKNLIIIYSIAGALYGLAGVLESAKSGGSSNNYGNMYELDAIAACVVGGVSTTGGIGTVPGILAGVLIFTVLNYGFTFIGINVYAQYIIKGLIIIAAVSVDIRKYLTKK